MEIRMELWGSEGVHGFSSYDNWPIGLHHWKIPRIVTIGRIRNYDEDSEKFKGQKVRVLHELGFKNGSKDGWILDKVE